MRRILWLFAAGLTAAPTVSAQPFIATVAGTGTSDFCGDGGPATRACLELPTSVAVDAAGDLFIADYHNYRVRKVDTTGTITTLAGSGSMCWVTLLCPLESWSCGDGGPASSAGLLGPRGMAVDAAGSLFIADSGHRRIRKVDAAGTITTVAGRGPTAFPPRCRISGCHPCQFCEPIADGGPATGACLVEPAGVAVDATDTLFIADTGHHRVRRVDAAGTIETVAGQGIPAFCGDTGPAISACLKHPGGVAADATGGLVIADTGNNRIRRVDPTGTITTVAGNGTAAFCGDHGPAASACLSGPTSVAVDAAGDLFIADTGNHRIRKVDATGTITTVAGHGTAAFCGDGGPATSASLHNPLGVAVDAAGSLFIADSWNHVVRKVDASGTITTVAGSRPYVRPASLVLSNTVLSGCLGTRGKITLTAPAPDGGLLVTLHSDSPRAVVPASIRFAPGAVTRSFAILTSAVASPETVTIDAGAPCPVVSARLTLAPMRPKAVTLLPNPVVGGTAAAGTVALQCPAGPGDIVVTLASTKPFIAEPTTETILIPVGTQTFPFEVRTTPVFAPVDLAIKATANEVTKSRKLTLEPAP